MTVNSASPTSLSSAPKCACPPNPTRAPRCKAPLTPVSPAPAGQLGLVRVRSAGDGPLIAALLDTLHRTGADFTNAFRLLAAVPLPRPDAPCPAPSPALVEAFASQCASLADVTEASKPPFSDHQFAIIVRTGGRGPGHKS